MSERAIDKIGVEGYEIEIVEKKRTLALRGE
jgi:hypothetical protein